MKKKKRHFYLVKKKMRFFNEEFFRKILQTFDNLNPLSRPFSSNLCLYTDGKSNDKELKPLLHKYSF